MFVTVGSKRERRQSRTAHGLANTERCAVLQSLHKSAALLELSVEF